MRDNKYLSLLTILAKIMLSVLILISIINLKPTLINVLIILVTLNELCTRPQNIEQLKVDMRIVKLVSLTLSIIILLRMNGGV